MGKKSGHIKSLLQVVKRLCVYKKYCCVYWKRSRCAYGTSFVESSNAAFSIRLLKAVNGVAILRVMPVLRLHAALDYIPRQNTAPGRYASKASCILDFSKE